MRRGYSRREEGARTDLAGGMSQDTIYALGTGAGRAAIAVIRLSGPRVRELVAKVAGRLPAPRVATFATLRDPAAGGEALDQGLVLWFPGPGSATGEDYAELQLHGGRAVVDAALTALRRLSGLRLAEPGEFARRGFANGKLDLSQAEALADLVDAQTEFQRRQALRVAGGELRRRVEEWRRGVIDALALVEAELDFSDEEAVGPESAAEARERIGPILTEMREALGAAPASERMRDGFTVLILGPPNAGKSTLLNALARRDVAIVSELPGTTRDMIEVHLDLSGLPVTFVDTAGLREATDAIEAIGVNRTLERAANADLLLWLSEGGAEAPPPDVAARVGGGVDVLRVASKSDLAPSAQIGVPGRAGAGARIAICAKSGDGLAPLLDLVAARARDRLGDGASALLVRERHRAAVGKAAEALKEALAPGRPLELVAEDLRRAGRALGRIVGAVDVEEVLDAIFSRFCIGK